MLNPLGCPAEERSREGDELLVTYKVSSRRECLTLTFSCQGALADGKVFNEKKAPETLTFPLGVKAGITGWDKGLLGTCAGEKVLPGYLVHRLFLIRFICCLLPP